MNQSEISGPALRAAPDGTAESLELSLARGLAWTGASKAAVQGVAWLATMVVARLLQPSDYGIIQLASVCLSIVALFNELSIGIAIVTMRELDDEQIAQLNGLSMRLGLVTSGITVLAAPLAGKLFGEPSLPSLLALMSPLFLLNAARTVPQALLQRELRFRLLAFLEASQALVGSLGTLGMALGGLGYLSLALGRVISNAWWTVLTLVYRRHSQAAPRLPSIRGALGFSMDVFGANLAWFAYSNLHFLLVAHFLGTTALGIFTIAWTLAHIAVDRIAALLVGVVPSYFSLLNENRPELRRYFLAITEGLAFGVVPVTCGTSLVAAQLVPVVLGARWIEAIGPLQILPLYAAFFAVASLLPHVLRVLGETRLCLLCNVATAIGMLLAIRLAIPWGINGVSWTWVLVYPLLTLPLYLRLFHRLEVRIGDYLRALYPALSSGAVMAGATLLCGQLLAGTPDYVRLGGMVLGGAVGYIGCALVLHPARVTALTSLLRTAFR